MKFVGLVALCVCALSNAAVTFENDAGLDRIQHSLGNSEYYLTVGQNPTNDDLLTQEEVAAVQSLSGQRSVVTGQIRDLLEGFREVIIHGNDDIPVLDPFVVDHFGPFVFTTTGVRVSANIRNFRVEGLKWFIIDRVSFNPNPIRLSAGLQITVPWIVTQGSYDAQASILFVTHRSGGNFRVFVNRLVFSVDARLGTNLQAGHLLLRSLDIKIDIHDTHIQIDGLTGSALLNTMINTFVQSITQDVVQNEMENVSALISEMLFDVVNEVLSQFTLDDLLGSGEKVAVSVLKTDALEQLRNRRMKQK